MKKYLYLLVSFILLIQSQVHAHPGGHYQKGDGTIFNTWQLKNGLIVKGNFSFAKAKTIYLEQEGGLVKAIAIHDLSIQDQKLANLKMSKFNELNQMNSNIIPVAHEASNRFLPFILLFSLFILVFFVNRNWIHNHIVNSKLGLSIFSFTFFISIFFACSKSETSSTTNPITNPTTTIPKTTYTFVDSAFDAFKPTLSTRWDDTYFYVASTGLPTHNMMIGITNWQQQVPISQPYNGSNSWSIPLQPVYAAIPLSTKTNLMKGAVAIAVNGIPIFNALNNRGEDSYKIGELDNWGGHCGKGDDYHYHAAPLHLAATNGLKPIAFALDGFPVFGAKEPDGTNMNALDTCHGHIGSNGIYHYHGTSDYPYVIGAMRGKVSLDPSTSAPENQILPQAFTKPVRPATAPLNGASITDFVAVGTNGYMLTYKIGNKNGFVKYSWDVNSKYTYILTDTAGNAVTSTYQR